MQDKEPEHPVNTADKVLGGEGVRISSVTVGGLEDLEPVKSSHPPRAYCEVSGVIESPD